MLGALRRFSTIISCRDLHKLIQDKTPLYIVDCSYNVAGADPISFPDFHFKSRLPNAKFFDMGSILDKTSPFPNMLPSEETFTHYMKSLQIKNDGKLLVCYDRIGARTSPRVWYTFKCFSKQNIAVLDGGLPKWLSESLPIDSGEYELYSDPSTQNSSDYNFKLDPGRIKSLEQVNEISSQTKSSSTEIMDARSPDRFSSNNIPGSKNVFFGTLFNKDMTFKPKEELRSIFEAAGVSLNNSSTTVHSCGTGVTACITLLAMEIVGKTNVSLYDGSWSEYELQVQGK